MDKSNKAMSSHAKNAPARLATRLAFFAAGFAVACWAPLIPFVKANVGANDAQFGLLLLCLGLGSIFAMPSAGIVVARQGARTTVLLSGLAAAVLLPILSMVGHSWTLACALFLFGGALGALDVAMNVHGTQVESLEERPLMSGFHAQFSLGALFGAGLITLLLSLGASLIAASLVAAALTLGTILVAAPRILHQQSHDPELFALPRGIVILIALLTAVTFLVEGAVLDWGALLVVERGLAEIESAGVGFILFSIAMVLARFTGDRMVAAIGESRILIFGGGVTILGIAVVLVSTSTSLALAGFAIVGLGAANIAPILFSKAGRQNVMPVGLAVASVTTVGYAGHLLGPVLIGFAAQITSLPTAFWLLVFLMAAVPISAWTALRR